MSLGDKDGKAPTGAVLAGEFVSTASQRGPLGEARSEPGRVGPVWLMVGLEDFIAGHGESFRGKTRIARNLKTF